MSKNHIPNTDWEWVTETANEPELTKKPLTNSIGQLLEAFHHIFHDGTCKIKTLITEERGELAHMMIIFITILLFLGSSLYQYLRPHLNYCTPWFTRWLVNSLGIKLPTFLSWVSLSAWLFPFLATLVLLCPTSLLYIVHAHCLQRGTGRMEYMRHRQVSPSSFTLQSALWNVLSMLHLINHPSILEKLSKQERDACVKVFLWQKGIGKGYRAMPLWHLSSELLI